MVDTCAADGLCAIACPVGIDTGKWVKQTRASNHRWLSRFLAKVAGRHWSYALGMMRVGLRIGGAAPRLSHWASRAGRCVLGKEIVPLWEGTMPSAGKNRPKANHTQSPEAVYFPSCLEDVFAQSNHGVSAAFLELCEKARCEIEIPTGVGDLCCSTPWASKGFIDGRREIASKTVRALFEATHEGAIPVVVDASSCTHGLQEMPGSLNEADLDLFRTLRIVDAVTFVAETLIDRLFVSKTSKSIVIHPTCSTTHLGINSHLETLACQVSSDVTIPLSWGCCGFAGDRGLFHPELTDSATRQEATEISARTYDYYVSANRTCEMAMQQATGKNLVHLLEVVNELSEISHEDNHDP